MKTYNQKARKREPFKPISNEFDLFQTNHPWVG